MSATSDAEAASLARAKRASRGGATFDVASGSAAETLPVVRADWAAPAHVVAFCTTRAGGVSEPPYDTLNLGLHVGDDASRVAENRRRLGARLALPAAPSWLVQVHGTRVARIGGAADGTAATTSRAASSMPAPPIEADGAWTEAPARVLGVLTADCLPVVITDAAGSRVAVAHAGWRGLAAGVLAEALAPFAPEAELHVWLGPAIGPDAFEVGAEVREAFVRRDAAHEAAFVALDAPGKYLASLYALARRELRRGRGQDVQGGSIRVTGGDRCTVREAAHFHSHRRDGARSGRMATLAWLARRAPGRAASKERPDPAP